MWKDTIYTRHAKIVEHTHIPLSTKKAQNYTQSHVIGQRRNNWIKISTVTLRIWNK